MPAIQNPSNLHSGVRAGHHVQAVRALRASLLLCNKHLRISGQLMCCNFDSSTLRFVHSSKELMLKLAT